MRYTSEIKLVENQSSSIISAGAKNEGYPVYGASTQQIEVAIDGVSVSLKVKVRASFSENVDFSQPASRSNPWSYIALVNLENGVNSNGQDGASIAVGGVFKFDINSDKINKLAVEFIHTSGTFDSKLFYSNNS